MKQTGTYNRIWLPVAVVLTVLLSIISVRGMTVQTLALEQQARCGIEEHVHTENCYENGKFVCYETVHTHTENCYLVLLKDNDINTLLTQVEQQPDNALETVIGQSVDNALQFNQDLTSPLATEEIRTTDVAAINETIEENDIQPQVTLNENLYTSYSGYDGDIPQGGTSSSSSDTSAASPIPGVVYPETMLSSPGTAFSSEAVYEQSTKAAPGLGSNVVLPEGFGGISGGQDGGVSTLSLDDPVQTGTSKANYYVYLDNGWRTVGTLDFSSTKSGNRYNAYESTSEIQRLYNNSLGLSLTTNDIILNYATSATSNSWTRATKSGNNTYFGTNYNRQNTAKAVKYVRLVDSNGQPLAFYTVTLRYLDGTEEVRYLRSGASLALPVLTGQTEQASMQAAIGSLSTLPRCLPSRSMTEECASPMM